MSKLAGKTTKWLQDAEKTYLEGMPSVTDANRKRLMQIGLDAVQDELKSRAQKKSDPQPSENPGQSEQKPEMRLPTKEELQVWQRGMEAEQAQQNQRQEETARAFTQNPVLTAPQPKALTKIPAPTKPIKWANGEVKEMNELDLRRKSVDYFSDVLNGKRLPSEFYRSIQFHNLVRFQIGLYRFGHPIMAHVVLHPTYNKCEKKTQERSLELFRQVHDMWNKYKDTDIV